MLAAQLMANHTSMSIKTRGQLLDDAFNLAAVDMVSYKAALDLTHFLEREKEYVPWRAVLTEMDYIDIMLYETEPWTEWRVKLISTRQNSSSFLTASMMMTESPDQIDYALL